MSTIKNIILLIKILLLFFLKKKKQAKDNIRALKQRKKITLEFSAYFKKICREVLKYNYLFIDLLKAIDKNEMEDYAPTYFPPKSGYWTPAPSKDVELYKKPTKRTIDIGFKRRKKDFLNKFIKKDKIENYYPSTVLLNKSNLKRYLSHIKKL